jgi:hypothetical protein
VINGHLGLKDDMLKKIPCCINVLKMFMNLNGIIQAFFVIHDLVLHNLVESSIVFYLLNVKF